jgi:hypothetical protein
MSIIIGITFCINSVIMSTSRTEKKSAHFCGQMGQLWSNAR